MIRKKYLFSILPVFLFGIIITHSCSTTPEGSAQNKEIKLNKEKPEKVLDTLKILSEDVYDARDYIAVQEYISNGIPRGKAFEIRVNFGEKQELFLSKMDFIVLSHSECLSITKENHNTFVFLVQKDCHIEPLDNTEMVDYALYATPKENVVIEFEGLNGLETAKHLDTLWLQSLYYNVRK